MTVPAAIIFAVFLYVPFIRGIGYSFTNSQGYGNFKWVGLRNYTRILTDDGIWATMQTTAHFLFWTIALSGWRASVCSSKAIAAAASPERSSAAAPRTARTGESTAPPRPSARGSRPARRPRTGR